MVSGVRAAASDEVLCCGVVDGGCGWLVWLVCSVVVRRIQMVPPTRSRLRRSMVRRVMAMTMQTLVWACRRVARGLGRGGGVLSGGGDAGCCGYMVTSFYV